MESGLGQSQGWETIVLPFSVRTITHESKGQLVPFAAWEDDGKSKPFWLYRYTSVSGWTAAENIQANTAYIICMPCHPDYSEEYQLRGNVTFAATDTKVNSTENVIETTYNGRTFVPNYKDEWKPFTGMVNQARYALNVNNIHSANTTDHAEGSIFVKGLRHVHPFEAYMLSTEGASEYIGIFDEMPTLVHDMLSGKSESVQPAIVSVFNIAGQVVREVSGCSPREAVQGLPQGIYIVNGKKMVVR